MYWKEKLPEREIKEKKLICNCILVLFHIVYERVKYLLINLTGQVKDVSIKSCKTLIKETKENTNRKIFMDWKS